MCLAALTLAASCGDDDDETASSTTSAPEPQTTTTLSPEEEVEAAYLAYAEMGERLLENPDPEDPEIQERASGQAQADLVDGLTRLQERQQHLEFGSGYAHRVISVDIQTTTATVEACIVDDARRIDESGATMDEGVTTVWWTVSLRRSDHSWRVDEIQEGDVEEGNSGCG